MRRRSDKSVNSREAYITWQIEWIEGAVLTASETDQQLVQRAQRGDLRAFDLLVLKYQGRIAALVSRYVSDPSEVEDVTQEAFIKAYRAIDKFRGDSAFYTWLYRIAANAAKNYLVSRRRRPGADATIEDAEVGAAGRIVGRCGNPRGGRDGRGAGRSGGRRVSGAA